MKKITKLFLVSVIFVQVTTYSQVSSNLKDNTINNQSKIETLSWYKNGNKKVEELRKDNLKIIIHWHKDGYKIKQTEISYKDKNENKKIISYYSNGQKKQEVSYLNNQQNGSDSSWYRNGTKESKYNYKKGKKEGLQIKQTKDGNFYFKDEYKANLFIRTFYHYNGKKRYIVRKKNNKEHGLNIEWYQNGNKKQET